MWLIKMLLLGVVVYVAGIFSIQNQNEVFFRFVFPWENHSWFEISKVTVPLYIVVFCSIFLGILLEGMGNTFRHFQLKRLIRQNQRTIEHLEKEIQSLRGFDFHQTPFFKEKDNA